MKQHLIHLDRVAGELNAWLLVVAIGLAMLDFTVLITKCLPALPTPSASFSADRSGTAVAQPLSSKPTDTRG